MSDMKEMYEKGYQAGHSDGFKRGKNEGYKKGLADNKISRTAGLQYKAGYHCGHEKKAEWLRKECMYALLKYAPCDPEALEAMHAIERLIGEPRIGKYTEVERIFNDGWRAGTQEFIVQLKGKKKGKILLDDLIMLAEEFAEEAKKSSMQLLSEHKDSSYRDGYRAGRMGRKLNTLGDTA